MNPLFVTLSQKKHFLPNFYISFGIPFEHIHAKGTDIFDCGFSFITLTPVSSSEHIHFNLILSGCTFSKREYHITGIGYISTQKTVKKEQNYYQHFFSVLSLNTEANTLNEEICSDINLFESNFAAAHVTLSDFEFYSTDTIFKKSNLFYDYICKNELSITYNHLNTANSSTAEFTNRYTHEKKSIIMLGSNNYLGLANHPLLKEAAKKAIDQYGTGCGSGTVVGGTFLIHKQLEEELAQFLGKEDALLFNSGYTANLGIISGLMRRNDLIINDELNHASIFDGSSLSRVKTLLFSHNNCLSLQRLLQRNSLKYNGKLIVVEGVYSTTGEIAPLKDICEIAHKFGCSILVDEAHSFGLLGNNGKGACEYYNVLSKVDIIMGSLNKSLAGEGGFAASDKAVITYLRYFSRPYLFSTSFPPVITASLLSALKLLRDCPEIRDKLWSNVRLFKKGLDALNIPYGNTESAIIPVFIPNKQDLLRLSNRLFHNGLYHNILVYPAVREDEGRLRFSVTAGFSENELFRALDIIERSMEEEHIALHPKKE